MQRNGRRNERNRRKDADEMRRMGLRMLPLDAGANGQVCGGQVKGGAGATVSRG